jgi:ribonucleoside-diphosphate reductase beta chain
MNEGPDSLVDEKERYVLFPIENGEQWTAYKDQEASFWTAEEMDMTDDVKHYQQKLNVAEQRLLCRVLGFFASSDTIVAKNIDTNFVAECDKRGWLEATVSYQFQMMMENVHSEAYSLMIQNLLPERQARDELFRSIHTVPSIKAKADLALRWMGSSDRFEMIPDDIKTSLQELMNSSEWLPQNKAVNDSLQQLGDWMGATCPTFGERLIAFVCVEAIFFSTSFAVIFWFKKRGLLPGICFANELIIRDEGMHQTFGELLVSILHSMAKAGDPLGEVVPPARILEIVRSFVELEQAFCRDSLEVGLAGINADKMCRYAEFVADRVLLNLGCERFYYAGQKSPVNPCEWMESIGLHHKTNFFERRVASYQRRGVKQSENAVQMNTYRTDADF